MKLIVDKRFVDKGFGSGLGRTVRVTQQQYVKLIQIEKRGHWNNCGKRDVRKKNKGAERGLMQEECKHVLRRRTSFKTAGGMAKPKGVMLTSMGSKHVEVKFTFLCVRPVVGRRGESGLAQKSPVSHVRLGLGQIS